MSYENSAVLGIREAVVADISKAQDGISLLAVLKNAIRVAESVMSLQVIPAPTKMGGRYTRKGDTATKILNWLSERPMTRVEIVDRMVATGICKSKDTAFVNVRHHFKKLFENSIEEVEDSNPIKFRRKQ